MAGWLSSPRRRRRLAWGGGIAAVAGGLAGIGVVYSNTGHSQELPMSNAPPSVYVAPVSVPLAGARKEAAWQVADAFVADAVLRRHVAESWSLVAPSLKRGYTAARWGSGDIPVVPFPSSAFQLAKLRVSYSYRDRLGLDILIVPKPRSGQRAIVFNMELRAFGPAARKHWLVSSWLPAASLDPRPPDGSSPAPAGRTGGLGAVWLLVPAGVVGLGLFFLVGLAVRGWYRGARAMRAYRSGTGAF